MKLKKIGIMLCVVLLLVVGCGKKELTPQEVFDEAIKKMETLENASFKMNVEVAAVSEGESQSISVAIDGKIDDKNKMTDMTLDLDLGGISIATQVYTEEVDGNTITYTKDVMGDGYTKTTEPTDSSLDVDFNEVADFFNGKREITKVKSDIDKLDKYEVKITKDDFQEIFGSVSEILDEDMSGIEIKNDLVADIYINEEGYMTKVVIDMKDVIGEIEGVEYTKLSLTIELTDINKTTVTIPDDVRNNAVEEVAEDYDYTE